MNFTIKPTYIIIGLAIALSACSQDDIPGHNDGDTNQIVFRTSLPELTSRAKEVTEKNLRYFCVTAFDFDDPTMMDGSVKKTLFANEKINVAGSGGPYSSPKCCWPDQGKESHQVSFFGFYPGLQDLAGAKLENESTVSTLDYKLTGFRVAPDIADQLDFITAYTTGTMADNLFTGITLPFVHQLSRIEVKAYGKHKSCDIEIAGVRIGGTGVKGTFDFKPVESVGAWSDNPIRGTVEYVYREGDTIVTCGKNHPIKAEDATSIMGRKRDDGNDNCAMLIPSIYAKWDYANDCRNSNNQMYLSVLLRVTDATTPTAGQKPAEKQRYPYKDLSHGADALKIPPVYFAVDKASGAIATRLYKNGTSYFTDSVFTDPYNLPDTTEIKEFGWAALPVTANWAPGHIYTYILDYTQGVGLHDPSVTTTSPAAGDPVISDKVGITYSVKEWNVGGGSEFPVPGS